MFTLLFIDRSRIDPRQPRCHLCQTMTSVYWRVPARNRLLCNNCFINDCKTSHQYCKFKRLDGHVDDLSTLDHRCHLSTQLLSKDEQAISSSSSSSSSTNMKSKRLKTMESNKSQMPMKISTRQQQQQQLAFRSNRKTMAFKSKKVTNYTTRRKMHMNVTFVFCLFFSSQKNVNHHRLRSN
jgi:uncharacterized protein (UPF0333 family)